jgi:hypothetical protein
MGGSGARAELADNALEEFLGLQDSVLNHPDVHGGLARLAGALAVDTVLSNEDKGVGEDIERNQQASGGDAVLKLAALEFVLELGKDAAAGIGIIGHSALFMMKRTDRRTLKDAR